MDLLRHSVAQWLYLDEVGDAGYDPGTPERSEPWLTRADQMLEHVAPHLPDKGAVEALSALVAEVDRIEPAVRDHIDYAVVGRARRLTASGGQ